MPLLLRTAEQDRGTYVETVMSVTLSMLALVRDDDISLDCAFIMLGCTRTWASSGSASPHAGMPALD